MSYIERTLIYSSSDTSLPSSSISSINPSLDDSQNDSQNNNNSTEAPEKVTESSTEVNEAAVSASEPKILIPETPQNSTVPPVPTAFTNTSAINPNTTNTSQRCTDSVQKSQFWPKWFE